MTGPRQSRNGDIQQIPVFSILPGRPNVQFWTGERLTPAPVSGAVRDVIRLLSSLGLCGILLGCSGTTSTGAPPPAPHQGLPTAPPTVSAETPPEKKECSCKLKLRDSKAAPTEGLAITGELPQGPFDLERRSACTAPLCKLDGFVPDAAFLQTTHEGVPSNGAIWLETIADQSVVQLPAADGIDAVALVLEGSVAFGEGDAKKAASPAVLETWGALRAPGAGYFLKARGRASVLMAVTARTGTLAEAVQAAGKGKSPAPAAGRLETVNLSKVTKVSWGGGAYHARIAFGGLAPSLTLIQATGSGSIPENVHAEEWEHIAILRGGGDMLLGDAKYPVRNGAVFQVPRGVVHGWTGTGQELAAVLVYSPGGPEQRFIQLAGHK
jgi:quercetin dioxygenase-like cupin family protein